MPNRRRLPHVLLLLVAAITAVAVPLFAWGRDGHTIMALIAERHLSDVARREVRDLLADSSLAQIATRLDEMRRDIPGSQNWHHILIPRDSNTYVQARDCRNPPCLIEKINETWRALANPNTPRPERREALIVLVHLVGDLHQPLHISGDNLGQNQEQVQFFGAATNLHGVWDTGLLTKRGLAADDYAARLNERLEFIDSTAIVRGTPLDWAVEAHGIARERAYVIPPNRALDSAYFNENVPELETQLLRAGVRLAWILNRAFTGVAPRAELARPAATPTTLDTSVSAPLDTIVPNNSDTIPPLSPGEENGIIQRIGSWLKQQTWFDRIKALVLVYLVALIALLIAAVPFGSAIFSKNWLLSLASKPLVWTPGFGRSVLFLGYGHRLREQRALKDAARDYFGLPANGPDNTVVLPDASGEELHGAIANATGPQRPVIITGTGGAGKSTLLARLAYLGTRDKLPAPWHGYTPVLVPSSYYDGSLIKAIADTLRERDGVLVNEEVVAGLLQSSKLLILFDGISEAGTDRRKAMEEMLRTAFNADYARSRFVFATRVIDDIPHDIARFTLQPLKASVISTLIDYYRLDTARANRLRRQLEPFADRPIEPLLFTMMLHQTRDEATTTQTRADVYEGYFRHLLRTARDSDEWAGWRDALEHVAWRSQLLTGERGAGVAHESLIEFLSGKRDDSSSVESIVARLQRVYGLHVASELTLLNHLAAANILQKGRRWRFSHDTFEEFFTASFLVSFFDRHGRWPDLSQWTSSSDRMAEFLPVMDFVRGLADGQVRRRMSDSDIPALWRERLSQPLASEPV